MKVKQTIFLVLAIACVASASLSDELTDQGFSQKSLYDGFRQFIKEHDDYIESILVGGFNTVFEDPALMMEFASKITSFTEEDKQDVLISCAKGGHPNFFKFLSTPNGKVGPNGSETITLEHRDDDCFESVQVEYTYIDEKSVKVVFKPSERRAGTAKHCKEVYTIATTYNYHTIAVGKPNKEHHLTIKHMKATHMQAVKSFGLNIFKTCDKFSNILPDILLTVGLFAGGLGLDPNTPIFGSKPTWWMELLNPIFVKQANGYQWKRRVNKFIDLGDDEVHPGDFLIITRMDGLDQIIQWGTGTRSGHSVTLLEIEGEMYAVESQDAWYWPKKNIQRNKWSEWKQHAQDAGFNVALLPLRPEIRAKFNNTRAYEWFQTVENVPYGYHNFLFGFFDTVDQNLPAVVNIDFVYTVFTLIERFVPSVATSLIGEAVNKRLNTTNLNLAQLYEVMFQRNLTVAQVFAIPEQDSWVYSDGPSMVCSSFVAAIWKAGGLYDGIDNIQATEFTPRDVYQTNFFDLHYKKPAKCEHDGLPYCQIMGKFRMDVTDDGYSTLDPYPNMYQTCPSMAPLYERTPGC